MRIAFGEALRTIFDRWSLAGASAAVAIMVASQWLRIHQTSTEYWLAADYGGRVLSLAVLVAVGFRHALLPLDKLAIPLPLAGVWIVGLVVCHLFLLEPLRVHLEAAFPETRLSSPPQIQGIWFLIDVTVGLALVAVHEEVVFRRWARGLLKPILGEGLIMIFLSGVVFGLYHWHAGIGNVVSAAAFGCLAMTAYKHMSTIKPVIIAHYLINALLWM